MYSLDGMGAFGFGSTSSGPSAPQNVELSGTPDLDSERFQSLWMQIPENPPHTKTLKPGMHFTTQEIEQTLAQSKIFCMASGQIGNDLKFFFYAQMADKSGYFLIETLVN